MDQRRVIFVYGTLKRGLCRAHFLNGQSFLGEARTRPVYRMFNCGSYPGLKRVEDGLSIRGELWEVDADCLARLDLEEGVAEQLYARRPIEIEGLLPSLVRASKIEAYFYLPPVTGFPDCGECWVDR